MKPLFVCLALAVAPAFPQAAPRIFPQPQEMAARPGAFVLDEKAVIALPANATPADRRLAGFLAAELADRWGLALRTAPLAAVKPGERPILLGTVANASVRARAARAGWRETPPEGYLLDVSPAAILVAGADERGAFYGFESLRQLIGAGSVPAVHIRDWPRMPFRAIKLYLPGRENIAFFKRFVRDFAALNKFNKLVLEMNAGMRLDRHPELNAGWIEFARDLNYSRRERSRGARGEVQDSTHHDTADGGVLEKEELADLVCWAGLHHIEVIPELPALTHSNYLLTRHRELAENAEAEWPDTYCPSLAASRKLYFDVVDEYIDVMKPAMLHIGHDEWRMPWGACPRCRNRHYGDLFGEDVRAIHAHLAAKGVKTAMWADHLIERLRGKGLAPRKADDGHAYEVPGGLTPEQVRKWIPRDILMFNWFWNDNEPGQGEVNDAALEEWGFQQIYGNMTPEIPNYDQRAKRRGVRGGAPSSWAATTEFNFGKDLLYEFLGTAAMLWSEHAPAQGELEKTVQALMPVTRLNLSGVELTSSGIDIVSPVKFTSNGGAAQAMPGAELKTGTLRAGRLVFELGNAVVAGVDGAKAAAWPRRTGAIRVGEDPTSIIFLHAAAKPARRTMAYRAIYNFPDTADLLGWYEVVYEDGFVETVPIRYQVNILEWNRSARSSDDYCYGAVPVNTGNATFYAYEWVNPRLGKVIREIRVNGTAGFRNTQGQTIGDNGIILAAVSVVKKRPFPDPVRAR